MSGEEAVLFSKKLFNLTRRKTLRFPVDTKPAKRRGQRGIIIRKRCIDKPLFKTVTSLITEPSGKKKAFCKFFLKCPEKKFQTGQGAECHHLNRFGKKQCAAMMPFTEG